MIACLAPTLLHAIPPIGGGNPWLDYWSFGDVTNWLTDLGYAPLSFTNLSSSTLGDGTALVLDSTNAAWLIYNVTEADTTNNITVDVGSIIFWFMPSWSGSNSGGVGSGQWGRFIEVGSYTTNASYGVFSLYTDPQGTNIYFLTQTNNGNGAIYLSAPIAWTNNYWHMVALTYSSSNSSLYLDGILATNNSTGVAYWPGPDVLANGFHIGSDSTGIAQAHGMFDDFSTYNYPLDAGTISNTFQSSWIYYSLNPLLWEIITPASYTNTASPDFSVVTGTGNITRGGTNSANCVLSTNIWITNLVATATNSGINLNFMIAGGADGVLYDVFANSILAPSSDTNHPWSWMGQGYHCTTNSLTITNQPNIAAFFILGKNIDSDRDGLTDAYELLVSKTDPHKADSDSDRIPDGWLVLHRLPTQTSGIATLDPDFDALTNLSEYLYGTDPQVSQGFTIWLASPAGFSGIP